MRRRILHVTPGLDPRTGGVTQAIITMIKGLSGEGMENEVVCLDDPGANYLGNEFPIYALGPGKGPWCYSSKLLPWLNQNLFRYDTVIVHGMWLYHAYATRRAARAWNRILHLNEKCRILLMPHGMLDPYFQKAPGRRLKAIRNFFYWKFLENKIVNEADGVLYTCDEELRLARQSFQPFAPKKETVVGLGVENPPPFSEAMTHAFFAVCPEVRDKPYFLFLSRIHEKKGVYILINAYKSIIENNKGDIPKLVIAGPGLNESFGRQTWEFVNNDDRLRHSVFFPGMLSGYAKWGAFYGCEAFALPSHQENFGIAVVEALACGKPVLISDQVNIWKEIEQFEAGKVEDDTLSGCKSLFQFWMDSDLSTKDKMSHNASALYQRKFAVAQFASGLASLLR